MDLANPVVCLRVLFYLDSSAAFRIRRCSKDLEKLLANDGGLHLWRDLLQNLSGILSSHSIDAGLWLHALVPEETLSLYATLMSSAELATALTFQNPRAVESLLEASCMMEGWATEKNQAERDSDIISPTLQITRSSYLSKGQRFVGSWSFNSQDVRSMLSGEKVGPLFSSVVEFRWMQSFFGGNFDFGVALMLTRVQLDRFALMWRPCVTTSDLLEEQSDFFEIHLHGQAVIPGVLPLGYEGGISKESSTCSAVHLPHDLTLSVADVTDLLEHDSLMCVLVMHVHCMGENALVTAANGSDPREQIGYRWAESRQRFMNAQKLNQMLPQLQNKVSSKTLKPCYCAASRRESPQDSTCKLCSVLMAWNDDLCIWYCSSCWKEVCVA
jgi:hypothetical protein